MAAETAAKLDAQVTLYDAMPSVGRKFLIAGKSGLNLTFDEESEAFLSRYQGPGLPAGLWRKIITSFDNTALRKWAAGLGIDTFSASSGKVFPVPVNGTIRAAPLLRRWIERLREMGVIFKTNHQWTALKNGPELVFQHGQKTITVQPDAAVLALGGASWPQTGSTGAWTDILAGHHIAITPLCPANCGWEVDWPAALLADAEGLPIKNMLLTAGTTTHRGELVITRYGIEGGPIYRLGPSIRSMDTPHVQIDFKPDMTAEALIARMGSVKRNFVREAGRRLKLGSATCAILKHMPNRGPWKSAQQLVCEIKHCHIPLTRPRPIEEAISSAGGIRWQELDDKLMLKKFPGMFVAGEMIDWEAPTGGYLLQACFATGTHAGRCAPACRL